MRIHQPSIQVVCVFDGVFLRFNEGVCQFLLVCTLGVSLLGEMEAEPC